MVPHTVYLANSSGLKVGITRSGQRLTRWIDQGAVRALPLLQVAKRHDAGQVEVALAAHVSDKTNWRAMLKGEVPIVDLKRSARELLDILPGDIETHLEEDPQEVEIHYPVLEYPEKINSLSFDKTPLVEGTLLGIKGQYLILDTGVINMRKFAGYHVEVSGLKEEPAPFFWPAFADLERVGPYGAW